MRKFLLPLVAACTLSSAAAASDSINYVNVAAEVRVDYQRNLVGSETVKSNTGFEGKYLNLMVNGDILPGLEYSWRQRFNKAPKDASFFDATDWAYIAYSIEGFKFSGGKQVVMIGGYEYDRAPIDLYSNSVFWNNVPCYQMGVSAGYNITPSDQLSFQVCQSPFYTPDNRDMYAYNLMWTGKHGIFSSIYSANLIEYERGRYISYLALGNRFDFGPVRLEADFMNRATSHQVYLFKDFSVMAELSYHPTNQWNFFAKYTHDQNRSGNAADYCVLPGTKLNMAGLGIEYFPVRNSRHTLRFHLNAFHAWGRNANSADVMQNKSSMFDLGVKWHVNIFSFTK